ncbi:hypothetical protein B0T20DRAFT_404228 [Sordaria brevicollis]|uniref:Uncharacterized protein n=1 Tax=Sordaria brevicollis TaxID=83679 RepID=A0AAE0UFI9_SORBR|nr:hypothetical protein B0T20DRAFT_404228 [Sordaria brevicollis]
MGERTGSRVFQWVWSYVCILSFPSAYNDDFPCFVGILGVGGRRRTGDLVIHLSRLPNRTAHPKYLFLALLFARRGT